MAMLLQCISTPVQGDKAEAAEGTHCNVIRTPASQQQGQQQRCNIRVLKTFLVDARQNANQLLEPNCCNHALWHAHCGQQAAADTTLAGKKHGLN
jgi:hypothetical protein